MSTSVRRLSRFFTIKQTAAQFAVSEKTVRRWIEGGLLAAHTLGTSVRIAEEDLIGFAASRRR